MADDGYAQSFRLLASTEEGMQCYAKLAQVSAQYIGQKAIGRAKENGGSVYEVEEAEKIFGHLQEIVMQANKILEQAKGAILPLEKTDLEKVVGDLVASIFSSRRRDKK